MSNSWSEVDTDQLIDLLINGYYAAGNAAFQRRNGAGSPALLSKAWEAAILQKWNSMSVEERNKFIKIKNPNAADVQDIRVWKLPEFQILCRLNSNASGNLLCEVTGITLTPDTFGIDRVINGTVPGVSGEYRNEHCLIMHLRLNDAKESGGRKVFATVDTLEAEKRRLGIIEPDHRVATTYILRQHLDLIREFRNSSAYQTNMNSLAAARNSI